MKLLDRSVLEVGTFRSGSLAARVHDRALIAMHGRKVGDDYVAPLERWLRRCCFFSSIATSLW